MEIKLIQKEAEIHPVNSFKKRSLTWKTLRNILIRIIWSLKDLRNVSELDTKFMEQIMLAVTSVNQCRYCSYYHTKVAIESGCSDDEIQAILGGDFSCANQEQLPALAFAQHFAESHEMPSKQALTQLIKIYGIEKAKQIITACTMITLGNLFGNTIDAYVHRFHGLGSGNGSLFLERLIYYISAIPALKINKAMKRTKKNG